MIWKWALLTSFVATICWIRRRDRFFFTRRLGRADRSPRYLHLPLVVGPDGRRLAKRHGDTRLSHYRARGVPASRILELLAGGCGIESLSTISGAGDLLKSFRIEHIPRERITFSAKDDKWLRRGKE